MANKDFEAMLEDLDGVVVETTTMPHYARLEGDTLPLVVDGLPLDVSIYQEIVDAKKARQEAAPKQTKEPEGDVRAQRIAEADRFLESIDLLLAEALVSH